MRVWAFRYTLFPGDGSLSVMLHAQLIRQPRKTAAPQLRPYVPQIKELGKKFDAICFNSYPSSSLAPLFPLNTPKFLIARDVIDPSSPELSTVVAFLRKHIRHAFAIGRVEGDQLAKWEIPHTIVYNSSPATPRFRELPPSPPIRFGAFGQLIPGKGFDVLAQACLQAAPHCAARKVPCIFSAEREIPHFPPTKNPFRTLLPEISCTTFFIWKAGQTVWKTPWPICTASSDLMKRGNPGAETSLKP